MSRSERVSRGALIPRDMLMLVRWQARQKDLLFYLTDDTHMLVCVKGVLVWNHN